MVNPASGKLHSAHWSKIALLKEGYEENEIIQVEIPYLDELVKSYMAFKGMKIPNTTEAFLFLTSEIGELADQIVSTQPGWVRHHPDKERGADEQVEREAADCLMMLTATLFAFDVDPLTAMIEKFNSKGWRQE